MGRRARPVRLIAASGGRFDQMLLRVGIPASFRAFTAACAEIGAPVLVSANAFRRRGRPFSKLRRVDFNGCDVALDSAGFVAMHRYGGFPWTVDEYLALATAHTWAWWASMDLCCEPELARDRPVVLERVRETARLLRACRAGAAQRGLPPPLPVLQGWRPDDYLRSADLAGGLPELVGVGSVCRRALAGPDGLMAVVDRIAMRLPVRLHLFGVKGDAIPHLAGHPAVHSVDSMAWDYAARRELEQPRTIARRADHLRRWVSWHVRLVRGAQQQLPLFRAA